MHNVYLYSGCYTLSPNADINWYTEKLGKQALLSEDDFVTYAADKKYSKNEKIACDLLYPAAKALDLGSAGRKRLVSPSGLHKAVSILCSTQLKTSNKKDTKA